MALLPPLRWSRRTWRKRFHCSSSWESSSTQRTWPRSWSRTLLVSSSSCRWKRRSCRRRSTVRRKPPCSWPPMLSRPSLANSTRRCTSAVTCLRSGFFPRGEWYISLGKCRNVHKGVLWTRISLNEGFSFFRPRTTANSSSSRFLWSKLI